MIFGFLLPFTSYKFLLYQLALREIKARYKQSFVGYAWVIFNPLAQLMVYSFVFSIVFRFPTNNIPYIVFLYAGLLPWTLFQSSLASATQSLVDNSSLLKKVAFPREVIPYATMFAKNVDFLFSSLLFISMMLFFRLPFTWGILVFPLLFLFQILLATGVGLLLAAMNLFYRDIQYLTNLLLMLWMYLTPVVYPLSLVPAKYAWLYKLNPMVGIMEGYRSAIFGYPFEWSIILWAAAVSLSVFLFGFWVFKSSEKSFADVV